MKKFITMLLRHWSKSPMKVVLTIAALALGSGILVLSLSGASILNKEVAGQRNTNGVILYVANGKWNSNGSVEKDRPAEWDSTAADTVLTDIESVKNAAVIYTVLFRNITTEGTSYDLRSAVGSDPQYFEVFSLDIVSGLPMTQEDIKRGLKKVWITEDVAVQLYGSAEAAIGKYIQPPGERIHRRSSGREQNVIPSFSVTGVYKNPSEVARRAYGISDFIFPYTSILPSGGNVQRMLNFMSGMFVVRSTASSVLQTTAALNQTLSRKYGEGTDILVWEGSTQGKSAYMEELRNTVKMFTVSVNILGILLLVTSSFGIFSIMVVESLSRRREIALERALGASQGQVIREFWTWSLALSFSGAVAGLILSLALSKPVMSSMSPLLGEIAAEFDTRCGVTLGAMITSLTLAVGFGGVLGLLPALSAVRGNIAETIKEI